MVKCSIWQFGPKVTNSIIDYRSGITNITVMENTHFHKKYHLYSGIYTDS